MFMEVRRRTYVDFWVISRRKFTVKGISKKNDTVVCWMERDISWNLAGDSWSHHCDRYNGCRKKCDVTVVVFGKTNLPTQ